MTNTKTSSSLTVVFFALLIFVACKGEDTAAVSMGAAPNKVLDAADGQEANSIDSSQFLGEWRVQSGTSFTVCEGESLADDRSGKTYSVSADAGGLVLKFADDGGTCNIPLKVEDAGLGLKENTVCTPDAEGQVEDSPTVEMTYQSVSLSLDAAGKMKMQGMAQVVIGGAVNCEATFDLMSDRQ